MPNLDPSKIAGVTVDQQAVIKKYGFELTTQDGYFVVVDPVYRKANGGKGGRYGGPGGGYGARNLGGILTQAVKQRGTVTEVEKAPSDKPRQLPGVDAKKVKDQLAEQEAKRKSTPSTGKTVAEAVAESPKDDEEEDGELAASASESTANTSRRGSRKERTSDAPAARTKSERKTKKTKEPKQRKDNRYLRFARVVVADLSIVPVGTHHSKQWGPNQAKLAKAVGGDLSAASAGHFFEAWNSITAVLAETGWLKLPAVQIVDGAVKRSKRTEGGAADAPAK